MLAMSTKTNPIFLFIFSLTTIIIPSPSFSLHFNLTTIGPAHARLINVTGNATVSTRGIDVTPPDDRRPVYQTGRATYSDPLHLWDRASGNLTSFSTRFSFSIDSNGSADYGDGLAFFLAPAGSTIQPWSYGGNLGLGNGTTTLDPPDSFVAVEFDTYENDGFDPAGRGPHVGIDVSSMASANTTAWLNDVAEGKSNEAWISYDASSMLLAVYFTGASLYTTSRGSLSREVDLRETLPEFVEFGFSAATAVNYERHTVESWEFSSFDLVASPPVPAPAPEPGPGPEPQIEPTPAPEAGISGPGPGPKPESGSGPGPEPEAKSGPRPEAEAGPGPGLEPETGPRPRPGPGTSNTVGNEYTTLGLSVCLTVIIYGVALAI